MSPTVCAIPMTAMTLRHRRWPKRWPRSWPTSRLAGRTIGVVSLLGMERQSISIRLFAHERTIQSSCAAALSVGWRTFQVPTRSVAVACCGPPNCKALSGTMFDQRFNVGATELGTGCISCGQSSYSDLSEADLRFTLLAHFENPLIGKEPEAEDLGDRCSLAFSARCLGRSRRQATASFHRLRPAHISSILSWRARAMPGSQ